MALSVALLLLSAWGLLYAAQGGIKRISCPTMPGWVSYQGVDMWWEVDGSLQWAVGPEELVVKCYAIPNCVGFSWATIDATGGNLLTRAIPGTRSLFSGTYNYYPTYQGAGVLKYARGPICVAGTPGCYDHWDVVANGDLSTCFYTRHGYQKWLALSSSSNTGQLRDCTHTTASTNWLTPSPLYTVDSVNNLAYTGNWISGQTTGDQACGSGATCLEIRDWACSPYNCGSPLDPSRMVLCYADCTPVPGYFVAPGYNNDYVDNQQVYNANANPPGTASICTGNPNCAGFVFNPSTQESWTKTNVNVKSHPSGNYCIYTKACPSAPPGYSLLPWTDASNNDISLGSGVTSSVTTTSLTTLGKACSNSASCVGFVIGASGQTNSPGTIFPKGDVSVQQAHSGRCLYYASDTNIATNPTCTTKKKGYVITTYQTVVQKDPQGNPVSPNQILNSGSDWTKPIDSLALSQQLVSTACVTSATGSGQCDSKLTVQVDAQIWCQYSGVVYGPDCPQADCESAPNSGHYVFTKATFSLSGPYSAQTNLNNALVAIFAAASPSVAGYIPLLQTCHSESKEIEECQSYLSSGGPRGYIFPTKIQATTINCTNGQTDSPKQLAQLSLSYTVDQSVCQPPGGYDNSATCKGLTYGAAVAGTIALFAPIVGGVSAAALGLAAPSQC